MIIDAHAHILPGADHGCRNSETAAAQLDMACRAGVDVVVASPHFYPGRETLDAFLSRRVSCLERLNALGKTAPSVMYGGEIFICRGLDHMDGLEQLCISGTRVMLTEMPTGKWDSELMQTLRRIRDERGIVPLIAHIDRYLPENSELLLSEGFACQVNCSALRGLISRRRYVRLIKDGAVSALGSDIHGAQDGYADFRSAMKILGPAFGEVMEKTRVLLGL